MKIAHYTDTQPTEELPGVLKRCAQLLHAGLRRRAGQLNPEPYPRLGTRGVRPRRRGGGGGSRGQDPDRPGQRRLCRPQRAALLHQYRRRYSPLRLPHPPPAIDIKHLPQNRPWFCSDLVDGDNVLLTVKMGVLK
jgi:hypothetical protein